jgi:hypothetical protein
MKIRSLFFYLATLAGGLPLTARSQDLCTSYHVPIYNHTSTAFQGESFAASNRILVPNAGCETSLTRNFSLPVLDSASLDIAYMFRTGTNGYYSADGTSQIQIRLFGEDGSLCDISAWVKPTLMKFCFYRDFFNTLNCSLQPFEFQAKPTLTRLEDHCPGRKVRARLKGSDLHQVAIYIEDIR